MYIPWLHYMIIIYFFTVCCYWSDWWSLVTPSRWMCAASVDSWDTRAGASSVDPHGMCPRLKCPMPVNCCSKNCSPWTLCRDSLSNATTRSSRAISLQCVLVMLLTINLNYKLMYLLWLIFKGINDWLIG